MTGATAWRELPVGARVVVRRRLSEAEATQAAADGRGSVWTDVIAVVLDVDDDGLTLRTDAPRDPAPRTVRVPGTEIETAKRIPPRPQRRTARTPHVSG
ncbi:hypothetical protein Xcel_0969 [Xylanimonas cellulosilytica DSM 15894]|uniref:Uncharacterized protein n=1 Tax=Xylanimonas cellulosilytica (strain DSM 15894 / JCM 12276 / CECT 5975 / KCTC 9989 / LMG 20990 / NBRC 107835 / XIL07) TaxID=446471 RepID=D1BYS5_XYLCX|nr:hypothetical protein [Xylanimonas cellulosilytica]ACZ30000.1 hypothetical protein Xcel_0969 [Xylanimonas cellulosilytica DSM 15894]